MITYEPAIFAGILISLVFIIIGLLTRLPAPKIITGCLLIIYLSTVASITLFPITYEIRTEYFGDITWYNYIPMKTIIGMFENGINLTVVTQIAGNVIMTIPYGIFIPLLIKRKNIIKLLLLGLSFAITIELLQLIIGVAMNNMYRTVDIDDVILNFAGVCIGYVLYKILPVKIKAKFIYNHISDNI